MKNILFPSLLLIASAAFAQNDPSAVITLANGETAKYNLADIENITFAQNALWEVSTIAGNGTAAVTPGMGTAAALRSPQGMDFDADGNLFICMQNNHVIMRMAPDGNVTQFATSGATMNAPWGCAFDSKGNLWVASKGNKKVFSFAPDGTATEIQSSTYWVGPMYVAFDKEGYVYVADRDKKAVVKLDADGKEVIRTYDLSDCKQGPCAVAVDDNGNIYTVNGGDYKVFMFTPDGERSVIMGNGTKPTAATWTDGNGKLADASMGQSFSVKIGSDGVMYISDLLAFVVRAITPDANGSYANGTVETIAGTPFTQGNANGIASKATFKALGTAVEHNGEIYVADNGGHLIRLISK